MWPGRRRGVSAELMQAELAWSIVLNPEIYDATDAWVRLTDLQSGAVYEFPGDGGYFAVTMAATAPGRASFSARSRAGL